MTDRRKEAYDYFKAAGWSPVQAAAIVGHGVAESGLDPARHQNGGNAYGGWQWDDRKPALLDYLTKRGLAKDDFKGQMDYVLHELGTTESFAAGKLRAATTPEEATAAFMHFERPQGYSRGNPMGGHNWAGRLAATKAVYDGSASYPSLGGGAVVADSVTASPGTGKVNWSDPSAPRSPISDVEMNQYRAQQAEGVQPYGFGEALWRETKDAQTMTWLLRGQTDLLPDPEWNPTPDVLKAAQEGIPARLHGQLGAATSEAHLVQLKAQILDDVEHEKRIDAMGWTGTGIRIGAAFTDIVGLGLTALAPEIGLPAKASRLSRVGVRAAEGAAINAALEAPRVAFKPTAEGTDILWAAGTGAALGGAFGAIARNPAVAGEAADFERVGKAMRKHADAEDAAGLQLATPTLPVTMAELGSTGGAMRTSPREALTDASQDWAHAAVDEAIARSWGSRFRFDLAGRGKGSDNAATRAFMGSTVTDVVGNADKSKVASRTAEEYQKQIEFDYGMMADKAHAVGFDAYAKRLEIPFGERATAREAFNREVTAVIDNRLPGVADFSPEAVSTAAKLQRGYAGLLELAKNPGLLDGSTRRAVRGFEEIPTDANYRPNIANHERIDAITTRFGDEAIRQFLAGAFRAAAPELPENVATAMSTGYLRKLREATAGMTNLDRALHGTDTEALRRALADMDLGDDVADLIVRQVSPPPGEGASTARAKRRTLYDTGFEAQVRARDGTWETLRMKDLFHEDSAFLFRSYARQMSGHIAMSMVQVRNPLHTPATVTRTTRRVAEDFTPEERVLNAVHDLGEGATLTRLHEALNDLGPEAVESALSKLRKSGQTAVKEPVRATTTDRLVKWLQENQKTPHAHALPLRDIKAAFPDLSIEAITAEFKALQQKGLGAFSQYSDPKTLRKANGHIEVDLGGGPLHLFGLRDAGKKLTPAVDDGAEATVQALAARPEQRFRDVVDEVTEPAQGAEFLINGITSREEFDRLVRDMRATWDARTDLPHATRKGAADADQKRMEFVYERVTGIPDQFDRTSMGRGLQIVRDYNFIRVMNQVGLAQIGEAMGIVTQFGVRAALEGIPTFKAMIRDAKTGELHSGFAREIEELSGFGADFFRDGWKRVDDDAGVPINRSAQGQAFNRVQDGLHTAKRFTSVISGMAPIDAAARRWASAAAVMKVMNAAVKSENSAKIKGLNMDRMRALGLDDAMAQRVFEQIRRHSFKETAPGSGRKLIQGGFREWEDQEAFAAFRGAVWRWSRLAIQENHLGQTNTILSSPMGRTILQFRSFMLGAYTAQFLRGLHHRDFGTFATWTMTSVVGAMVYAAQTYLNTAGRSDAAEEREKRLSPKALAAAAVQRGSWSSILPMAVDTGASAAGFEHLFDTRASGTASSFLGNPTVDLANTAFKASNGVFRAARQGRYSQSEARTLARILPFSNAIGFMPLLNVMISDMPEHRPRSAY